MCGVLLLKRVYTFIHALLHLFAHSTIQSKAANFKAEIKLEISRVTAVLNLGTVICLRLPDLG